MPITKAITQPISATQEVSKISSINGLRGMAVLAIIFYHSLTFIIQQNFHVFRFVGNGWLGVNLFFILSGFVLYRPYLLGQRTLHTWEEVGWFYRHRFFRLYPLFVFNAIVGLIINPVTNDTFVSFLLALTTLSQFTVKHFFPAVNVVFWSLMIEIGFSLVFPLIIWAINRYGMIKTTVIVGIIAILVRFAGAYSVFIHPTVNPIKDSLPARLDDFLVGMVIIDAYYKSGFFEKMSKTVLALVTITSIVSFLMVCQLWDMRVLGQLPLYLVPFLNNLTQICFAGLLIISLKAGTIFNWFFSLKPLQILGLMSYSIYVWHAFTNYRFKLDLPFSANYFLFLAFTFLLSALSYRYIEFGKVKEWRKLF